ncbi:glycosyltransferase family 4 protein [Flagellimonas sp. S3867]|uniref:glycosyltransferase family 4 protein n=1 Tax=Flagellimonas sp. S3867 TaxID=2768063 RepID=UPI00168436C3|nr:glycosyltransferase family 4 protein [Flagellimonas sp. S3867]
MVRKIKICLLGSEDANKRLGLAKLLANNGFDVTIMGTIKFDCPPKVKFIKYKLNRSLNPFSDFQTILEYRKIFKLEEFDIIQTFDTKPAFLAPLSYASPRTKMVRTITGLGTIFMSNDFKFRILRFLYSILHKSVKRRVSHTTFQNEDDRGYFLKKKLVASDTSSLIYGSGIDLDLFSKYIKKETEVFTFICIGRLVYEKGIINYLEAAKICKDLGHEFKFLLVGPLEENSKRLNSDILDEYSHYVEWLGPQKNIPELLQHSDVFVLPTFREGFSRVLLEASALKIPSITSNVPGTREIIRDNKEGILIPVNDSNALSKAMIKMELDRNSYRRYAENAKMHVNQFSLKNITEAYISLYKNILEFNNTVNPIKPEFS